MKKHLSVLILILSLFSSCCGMKDCINRLDEGIYLIGFSDNDVKSIKIISFEKGSNFITPIDSCEASDVAHVSNMNVYFPCDEVVLLFKYDYKIIFSTSNSRYEITEMKSKKVACNECFLGAFETDYYNTLFSYKINGKYVESSFLEIRK